MTTDVRSWPSIARRRLAANRPAHIAYKSARVLPGAPVRDLLDVRRTVSAMRVLPDTMLSAPRLFNAWDCVRIVEQRGLPGAIVECGVWSGGSVGLMALASAHYGDGTRPLHLFDSFEGLPQPSIHDEDVLPDFAREHQDLGLDDGADPSVLQAIGACQGAQVDQVRELLEGRLHIAPASITIWAGWFQETVPEAAAAIGPIAVLRLDGDWYESTKVCLEGLYDNVIPGGFVIIDDYGTFSGCRQATDEFFAARGESPALVSIDADGSYLRK